VRLAFTRKNKTLGAIFRQSRTLQLLESNHAVYQVMHPPYPCQGNLMAEHMWPQWRQWQRPPSCRCAFSAAWPDVRLQAPPARLLRVPHAGRSAEKGAHCDATPKARL